MKKIAVLEKNEREVLFSRTAEKMSLHPSIVKQKFYYAKSAHYETATLSDISLIPAAHIMDDVKIDYIAMKYMIYGDYPEFEEIINCLKKLEVEVHELAN